jgi:hypothetical protein
MVLNSNYLSDKFCLDDKCVVPKGYVKCFQSGSKLSHVCKNGSCNFKTGVCDHNIKYGKSDVIGTIVGGDEEGFTNTRSSINRGVFGVLLLGAVVVLARMR